MKRSKTSLLKKILIPILIVMLFQAGLFYCVVFESGTMDKLKNNSFHIFSEKVNNRRNSLQNDMISRWGNVKGTSEDITSAVQTILSKQGKTPQDIVMNSECSKEILNKISDYLLEMMRRNVVSGAFVIFNGDGSDDKSGIYFRDSDPTTTIGDYSDLLALRGPSYITNKYRIALDRFWTPGFQMDESDTDDAFYYRPFEAAKEHPEIESKDLGYWSSPFYLNKSEAGDSVPIITYSVPIILGGEPIGVMGVEMSLDYLNTELPFKELDNQNYGSYILAMGQSESDVEEVPLTYRLITQTGIMSKQLFPEIGGQLELEDNLTNNYFYPIKSDGKKTYGCVQTIKLYNTHTPFENEQWVLIGVVSDDHLLSFFYSFRTSIMVMIILSLLIGVAASFVVSKLVANPITALSRKLKTLNPDKPIHLERLEVSEIDELSDTIENLSVEVANNANKLSTILAMTDIKMGACEYNHEKPERVFCTEQFCEILGIEKDENYVESGKVKAAIRKLLPYLVSRDKNEGVYILHIDEAKYPYWLRAKVVTKEGRTLVVLTDISKDMEEKIKIEHERDYDILTNLFNRRAFCARLDRLFEEPQKLKQGAMVMLDLDNLKYVNDTYGHDYGDEYIRLAADVLKKYPDPQSVISRLSGDEFMIFVYGYQNQEEIQQKFAEMFAKFKDAKITFQDMTSIQVRASAGIAAYPKDAVNYHDLIRYADFAMYLVKKTNKGQMEAFNVDIYNKESYLLQCKEELNKLIEEELLDYMYQPIVSTTTGAVFAYEALMRPRTTNIKTPFELLTLARAQSKLHEIERLTFSKALEGFVKLKESSGDGRLFINSIANQCMSEKEIADIESQYGKYLSRIVLEITEEDKLDAPLMERKKEALKSWGAQLAIDDFGTGYNSEGVLLSIRPDYIKIDKSLVEGICQDKNKQMLLRHLVTYAQEHQIKTIAEGVETADEMQALILEKIDYLQGYYLARPGFIPPGIPEKVRRQIVDLGKNR